MAEGDGLLYNEFKFQLLNGAYNLANAQDTLQMVLVTGHTPDIDTDTQYSDVVADEVSGAGYDAGGKALTGQATSKDTGNDLGKFAADNVTWTGLDAGTPNYAVLQDVTASNLLIANWEIATASNGGNYTLTFSGSGIITIT